MNINWIKSMDYKRNLEYSVWYIEKNQILINSKGASGPNPFVNDKIGFIFTYCLDYVLVRIQLCLAYAVECTKFGWIKCRCLQHNCLFKWKQWKTNKKYYLMPMHKNPLLKYIGIHVPTLSIYNDWQTWYRE